MKTPTTPSMLSVAALLCSSCVALAGPFTQGNIVVTRVGNYGTGGAGAVIVQEYTKDGAAVGNHIDFPVSGADAGSLPDFTNHDRHIHLSVNGRLLALALYNSPPSTNPLGDPSGLGAAVAPRVVALIHADGTYDMTTRLTDSFDATSIRGAFTDDGSRIWLAGDNASGATVTGGLRFTTHGSGTSVNLSQVQSEGGSQTSDNIRDTAIFEGQLYDCSGSNSSVGKAVFTVGTGLPTSGSQTLTRLTFDGASTSSFYLLDLNPAIPGPDVMYAATSAAVDGIHKYVKQGDGTWVFMGVVTYSGFDHVIASADASGHVTVFAAAPQGVCRFSDDSPLTAVISGAAPAFRITPADGESFGGIDFVPVALGRAARRTSTATGTWGRIRISRGSSRACRGVARRRRARTRRTSMGTGTWGPTRISRRSSGCWAGGAAEQGGLRRAGGSAAMGRWSWGTAGR